MKVFTSDLHFLHRNICNYTDRGKFTNAENHTDWAIDIWNSQVSDKHDVYHLGDFCFSKGYETLKEVVQKLKGNKFFIYGNHDSESNFIRLRKEGLIEWCGHYKEIKIQEHKACLFHFPILAWHRQHYGSWHLFGHTHGNIPEENLRGKMLDVGLDSSFKLYGEHKFFTENMIIEYMNSKEIYIADGHQNRPEA